MKVLLVPNFEGWAFDIIAKGITKFGKHDYEIMYESEFRSYRGKEIPKGVLDFDRYDRIIVFAPWMHWSNLPMDKTICICHEDFEIDGYNLSQYRKVFITSDISKEYAKGKGEIVKVQAGVDCNKFFPKVTHHVGFKVGWVGSATGHKEKKGFYDYAQEIGKQFEFKPHLKEKDFVVHHSELVDYYNSIDVLIVTSDWEGYPLPILEATACGTPVVSTDVGIASEILPVENIVERDVDAFVERIEEIVMGDFRVPISAIEDWCWKKKIHEWEDNL